MKTIAHRALTVAAAMVALGTVLLPSVRAEQPGRDPNGMVGVWRCNGPAPSQRPEIISIQPDGYVVIDAAGHILVGTARIELPKAGEDAMVLTVKESDLRDSVGTTVKLGLKVNNGYSVMGTGFDHDRPFKLDRLCHRMEAEH